MDGPRNITTRVVAILSSTQMFLSMLRNLNTNLQDRKRHFSLVFEELEMAIMNIQSLVLDLKLCLLSQSADTARYVAFEDVAVENGRLDKFKQQIGRLQRKLEERKERIRSHRLLQFEILPQPMIDTILAQIEEFREFLSLTLTAHNIAQAEQLNANISEAGVEGTRHDQALARHRSLLEWISPTDYRTRQFEIIRNRQEGTGQWFLESHEVSGWLSEPYATLFCPGIPGAGKTMAAAIIIDHLLDGVEDSMHGVAYVYFDYKAPQMYDASDMLAAILRQLAPENPQTMELVERLQHKHAERGTRPLLDEVYGTLQGVISYYNTVYIVVDALDECQNNDDTRRQFLARLQLLQMGHDVRLLVTSRLLPEIVSAFKKAPRLEVRAVTQDVKCFIAGQIYRMPRCIQRDAALQDVVIREIAGAVDGMFLLARLHTGSLQRLERPTAKRVKAFLAKLSEGTPDLDTMYLESLQRIKDHNSHDYELAQNVLLWTTFARRMLTPAELCCALAIELDETEIDPDNVPDIEELVSVCVGLVTVDSARGVVGFAHYTAQNSFRRVQSHWFPEAETYISTICAAYLSFSAFDTGICRSDDDFMDRLQSYCFYDYAARYWGDHAKNTEVLSQKVIDFLRDKEKVGASGQALFVDKESSAPDYSQNFPMEITGLHLSAYFGLAHAVTSLLDCGHQPDCKDSNGHTPLWWSAKKGNITVTRLLCKKDTITLHLLTQEREEGLVKVLLKGGYNVNATDFRKRTPLHNAIISGSVELATGIVSAGADINARDMNKATPLRLALNSKQLDLINLLVEKSADTRDIDPSEWRRTFGRNISDILQLTKQRGGGTSLQFIPRGLENTVRSVTAEVGRHLHRNLLQFGGDSGDSPLLRWPPDTKRKLHVYDLQIHSMEVNDRQWAYSVAVSFPDPAVPTAPGPSLRILWNVAWDAKMDDIEGWRSVKHLTNLPYVFVPDNGLELFHIFICLIEVEWLQLCRTMIRGLNFSREEVLFRKGRSREQLDRLLQDGQKWIEFRKWLQRQVNTASDFVKEYTSRHGDIATAELCLDKLREFSDKVGREISQLDETSKGLIQMEFNLVSINEARRSTSASTSMKRLSWITFIFLPLLFISGLFGMNIDLLESNPPWWLYVVFATGTTIMTSIIWIVFKRNPNLEENIEDRLSWLVGLRAVRDEEQGSTQNRHKSD